MTTKVKPTVEKWESILKLGIIDEDEGTITFSYNELVNLLEGK